MWEGALCKLTVVCVVHFMLCRRRWSVVCGLHHHVRHCRPVACQSVCNYHHCQPSWGGGGDVRSARFPRVAKHTHVDYHQSMLLRSTRMQPHLHGPQYRSVMRIGVTRTMAHDKGAHDSLGCGAVLQYHMFYSLIVSCTTASPCRAGMHYIPIVSCRHVLQPNRVVQACATAQSCRAGMAQ